MAGASGQVELRFVEVRAEHGRVITGTAVPYGEAARMPWGEELIEAGAFGDVRAADLILNMMHDRSVPLARSSSPLAPLTVESTVAGLSFRAELVATRQGDDALAMVRSGLLRGASVEFRAERDAWEGDLRRVQRATLVGIALADRPAYPGALIEARTQARAGHVDAHGGKPLWPLL